jgi:hypothetical protein
VRKGAEEDIGKAEKMLWANGKKIEDGKESAQPAYE